jgi:hypothetical protein
MSGFPIQAYRMMSKSPFGRRCVSAFGESSALISMPTCFSCAWSASKIPSPPLVQPCDLSRFSALVLLNFR